MNLPTAEISELIRSVASLLWPILAFWTLRAFRADIAQAIARIKKAKVLGHEFELSPQLQELKESADQASQEVATLPSAIPEGDEGEASASRPARGEDPVHRVLEAAVQSPKVALLLLATEMEREGREVLASIGKINEKRPLPFRRVIERLDHFYGLPRHIRGSLDLFLETRNRLVHGGSAKDRDIVSALDSGVTIYRSLEALPRERNWIHNPGVPVYSDSECRRQILGVKGVILKTESASGTSTSYRIVPSTQAHYVEGRRVSWEWNLAKTWSEAWLRDPDSNEIKLAWSSAGEFVGRHFEDL